MGKDDKGLRVYLESQRRMCEEEIANFAVRLRNTPAEAFEWSQKAFQCAARLEAVLAILGQLGKGMALSDIAAGWATAARTRAKSCSSSTSPVSNYLQLCRCAAANDLVEYLEAAAKE